MLVAVAGALSSLPLVVVASVISGADHGLVFLGGLTAVNEAAPADRRAESVSTFYVIVYCGVGIPVIGLGLLAADIGLVAAVRMFALIVAALSLGVLAALVRTRGMPRKNADSTKRR